MYNNDFSRINNFTQLLPQKTSVIRPYDDNGCLNFKFFNIDEKIYNEKKFFEFIYDECNQDIVRFIKHDNNIEYMLHPKLKIDNVTQRKIKILSSIGYIEVILDYSWLN